VPKIAQIYEILGNFGGFLPGNKDSLPDDTDFLSFGNWTGTHLKAIFQPLKVI
jgi:hypothetical protein